MQCAQNALPPAHSAAGQAIGAWGIDVFGVQDHPSGPLDDEYHFAASVGQHSSPVLATFSTPLQRKAASLAGAILFD